MTPVTIGSNQIGWAAGNGSLDDSTIDQGGSSYTIDLILQDGGFLDFSLTSGGLDASDLTLHVDSVAFAFSAASYNSSGATWTWSNTGLSWEAGDTVALSITEASANNAPTAANKTVTVDQDSFYSFSASDFAFNDTDDGDLLDSVTIVSLPAKGALTLSGSPVVASQSIPAASLGNLTFTPASGDSGTNYASFTFKVNDGAADSVAYTMTIDVTLATNNPPTGLPTITGTPQVGQTLTANTSAIADADGLGAFSYQWIRGTTTDISGATGSTYQPVAADVGQTLKVRVSWTDGGGNAESLTSAPTAAVTAAANNPPTGLPTITGTPQVGQTLTASTSAIADADGLGAFSYQWIRGTTTDISGATGSTYQPVEADVGQTLMVRVSWTDGTGTAESLTSAPTAAVTSAPTGGRTVTLMPTPARIKENRGVSTVTATVSPPAATAFTATVSAEPAGDYSLSDNRTLRFAAGASASTGTVTVTARGLPVRVSGATVAIDAEADDADVRVTGAVLTISLVVDAIDDVATTRPGQSVLIDVLVNDIHFDGDPLTIYGNVNPANGTASRVDASASNPRQMMRYTPRDGFVGRDTFQYQAYDSGELRGDWATVTVTVTDDDDGAGDGDDDGDDDGDEDGGGDNGGGDNGGGDNGGGGGGGDGGGDTEPDPEPEALEVEIAGVPDVAVAGESYELTAQSDSESLVYAWRVDGGTVEPDDAQMVVWTAPETAGVAWIHVDVTREEDDATAGQSAYVRVEVPALPTTLALSHDGAPAEGAGTVTVTATLDNPAPSNGLTLTLTTGGTAMLDTDYTLSSTTISIAAGETAGTVTITVIDDAEDDDGETIVLAAESTSPALTAEPLTLTIEDNDVTPVPTLPLLGHLLFALGLTAAGARWTHQRQRAPAPPAA